MGQCRKALCFDTDNKEQMLVYDFLNLIKGKQTEFIAAAVKNMLQTNNLTLTDVEWMDRSDAKLLVKKYCNGKTVASGKLTAKPEIDPDTTRLEQQQLSHGFDLTENKPEWEKETAIPSQEATYQAEPSSTKKEAMSDRTEHSIAEKEPSPNTNIKSKQELTEKERKLLDELASFG